MLVEIRQEHCIGANYRNNYDCPLFRAIKEQHPEFPLLRVSSNYIRDQNYKEYTFTKPDATCILAGEYMRQLREENVWSYFVSEYLKDGQRGSVLLHINTPEYDKQQAELVKQNTAELVGG